MKIRNQVEFCIYGKYALFSDPITRTSGEKFTYQVPTYQALKGITESIYWKPTFIWVIDEVRIMNPIRTESKNIRPINYEGRYDNPGELNTLSVYTYLSCVKYQVRAHFIWNKNRPELVHDRDDNKHHNIAKRMIQHGGRRDIFFGTRECQGYVEPCVFGEGEGFYDQYGILDLALMFHGFDYPDETGRDIFAVRFWRPRMENGIIIFLLPEQCDLKLRREIRPMKKKVFDDKNFSGLKEPWLEKLLKRGETDGLDAETLRDIRQC